MVNHKYSTYALICILILVLSIGVLALFESEDLDEVCNQNEGLLKRVLGTWDCSITHYAQGWFHNVTNHETISITDTTTYFNVTGFTIDEYYGINATGDSVQINKNSTYRLLGTMSFHGGNAGDYEFAMFVNGVKKDACAWHRTTTSTAIGDATMSCIFQCFEGDLLQIRVRDHDAPAQDVDIVAFNFNIMEVQ